MDKLLLADDEQIVIESLTFLIHKHFSGQFEVFTAKSGREAVLLAEQNRIDIALLDISMPGITGIQAIEKLRAVHPDMVCIILTAFDKFDYAKTALHLGVFDYLLKPIRREKIVEVLTEARRQVAARKRQRLYELDVSERLEKANTMLEKELVGALLYAHALQEVQEHLHLLGLSQVCGYCMVAELHSGTVRAPCEPVEVVGSTYYRIRECLKSVGNYLIGSLVSGRLAVLRVSPQELEADLLRAEAEKIRQKLWQATQTQARVGIGHYFAEAEQASGSYVAAMLALRFAGTATPVVCYDDICNRQAQEACREVGISRPVQQAIAYIDKHYAKNLTLDFLAELVNVSPNYFSRLFKEEAGRNFIDYLTHVRMEKAKRLLAENKWSVKEVGLAVGYRDPSYFTRIFKKVTGTVPTDYA